MSSAPHIRVLPINVANKIAAGEVVERPASVVKELIENSIDAGATRIDIEIVAGGRKLIAISDNGSGMNRDDALLSVERQATSKIRDVDDIERINTLGFRGEALAAIASVSRFRLTTCDAGDAGGTELLISGGKINDVRDIGCPQGTAVEIRDLFFNVPARRKFLRTYQTESSHVRQVFIVQALAHPALGISLKIDGRDIYRLAPDSSLKDRLRDLFGPDYCANVKEVRHEGKEVKASGFVSIPSVSRSDRGEQYFFVNDRAATAPLLGYALKEAYHTLLPNDRHASVFVFLDMDPSLVDVNVHPTKKEVRFRHPSEVRDAVIDAVRNALAVAPSRSKGDEPPSAAPIPVRQTQLRIENLPPTRTFQYPRKKFRGDEPATSFVFPRVAPKETPEGKGEDGHEPEPAEPGEEKRDTESPWAFCRVLGQVGGLYVVLETEDGIVLMDPHAAHERVLFERFMSDILSDKVNMQNLLMPQNVELGPKDALRVRKNLKLFKDMGFGISEFGGDSFVVDAVPSYFADVPGELLLVEIAHGLEEAGSRGGAERWREESIAQAACKSAVKARDKLTLEEIEQLVVDLARAEMPYTCPHGRPTLIFTPFKELNKKFGRE